MTGLICVCGKEKESTRKKFCDDCRNEKKREKSRKDAKAFRARHGSQVKRGIHCSRCKGIKEHQERGYCLACERDIWRERDKPDCATCGNIKENPRDSYCNRCKTDKNRKKSIAEGRRAQNPAGLGRSIYCSKCKQEKQGSYRNESYCGPCKVQRKKELRPVRNEEQMFKDSVRKITWKKIADGTLIRLPCEVCGTEKSVEAHHDDYYRPLDVRWLCRKHHREHHKLNP